MKTKRVTMTGETRRDLHSAIHNPITDLRLSWLRAPGALATGRERVTERDKGLVALELDILNKLEAALGLPLRDSPPPNVRIEGGDAILPLPFTKAEVDAITPKKTMGRPKKSHKRSDSCS